MQTAKPTIPLENLYYLLCYAWNKLEERDWAKVDAHDTTSLLDLLGRVLTKGTTYLLKQGIQQDYKAVRAEIVGVKGKMMYGATFRKVRSPECTVCEYDEFDPDVLVNRVIRSTLQNLTKASNLDPEVQKAAHLLGKRMSNIAQVKLTEKVFDQLRQQKQLGISSFLIKVCELLYHNLLPSETAGTYYFRDFFRDPPQMAALFEAFVRNFYRRELPHAKVIREDIYWRVNATEQAMRLLPKMQTDISIEINGRKILIDTKFYAETLQRYYDAPKLHSTHLYQLFAYLKNHPSAQEGILLYPVVERELSEEYWQDDKKMRVETLNLAQPWYKIEEYLKEIVIRSK